MESNSEQQLTDSLSLSDTESQKARHIFSLLVFIGKPASLTDLASRCNLFPASPDLIASLCSLPNSPITLSNNKQFVAISSTGLSFLTAYLARVFTVTDTLESLPIRFGGLPKIRFGKRKRDDADFSEDEEGMKLVHSVKRIRNYCTQVHYRLNDDISRFLELSTPWFRVNNIVMNPSLLAESFPRQLSCEVEGVENVAIEMNFEDYRGRNASKALVASEPETEPTVPAGKFYIDNTPTKFITVDDEETAEGSKKEEKLDLASKGKEIEDICNHKPPLLGVERCILPAGRSVLHSFNKLSSLKNHLSEPLGKAKTDQRYTVAPVRQNPSNSLGHIKADQRYTVTPVRQNPSNSLGHIKAVNTNKRKQHGERDPLSVCNDQGKEKVLPEFESYTVEEEEGSGGYGTVYRARRKDDGALFAIKCPHANAHKNYISNELKMLKHFGGRNFVIKYEECIKSANSDCFVLQYVEHDKPDMLRKNIDVFQLQWYAYCLFKALANLHKQGIVHRDVKPANFLFSCKTNKGYIIDFNLAMDLHQKSRNLEKSELGYDSSFLRDSIPAKAIHPANSSKFLNTKSREGINMDITKSSRLTSEPKNIKKTTDQRKARNDLSSWNKINSQGADGSGITSAKDVSARTLSAERVGEPLPCQGRKELISLAQEAMQNPNRGVSHVPAAMRKRVAASPGKVDRQVLHPTPMPLKSTTFAISGIGLTRNKGDAKHRREGPCAGTKGYRAPEVLLRSQHQGPKVDIWSAGVTLLYLMIGKSPFVGEPEQNIKEIAQLRGSEDLWEVAKLHNRESSFPEDLYGKQYLTATNLREWFEVNTKRRDFLREIPCSLYDLVDKCLTVNPRVRITAEGALKHEFFQNLRKQRTFKQVLSSDNATNNNNNNSTINRSSY